MTQKTTIFRLKYGKGRAPAAPPSGSATVQDEEQKRVKCLLVDHFRFHFRYICHVFSLYEIYFVFSSPDIIMVGLFSIPFVKKCKIKMVAFENSSHAIAIHNLKFNLKPNIYKC